MANKDNGLELMGSKKYKKNREIHNKWWSKVCIQLMDGKTYNQALEIVGKPQYI